MHPSVCALRRIHLPLQGRLWGDCRPEGSPVRGAVGVSRLWGAAHDLANTLPVCLTPPRPCGAALTQNNGGPPPQTSPAGVNARPATQGIPAARPGAAARRTPCGCRLRRGRCLHRPASFHHRKARGLGKGLPLSYCLPLPPSADALHAPGFAVRPPKTAIRPRNVPGTFCCGMVMAKR